MKKIIYTFLVLITFCACDTELEVAVKDSFDFSIESDQKTVNFISEEIKTTITIEPERKVTGTKYFFSYKVENGEGFYKLGNTILTPELEYEVENLNFDLLYIGEDIDIHKTNITIRNNSDLVNEHSINYKIVDLNDFRVNIVRLSDEEIFFRQQANFELEIEKIVNELTQSLNYELEFINSSLNGRLLFNDNQFLTGQKLTNLSEEKLSFIFWAEEIGNLELDFLVKASNGKEKQIKVTFLIKENDFSFNIIFNNDKAFANDLTGFNFTLDVTGVPSTQYYLSASGPKGEIRLNGLATNTTTEIPIQQDRLSFEYRGLEISKEPIVFKLRDDFGKVKTKVVDFESLPTNFDIIPSSTSINQFYMFDMSFNVNIIPPNVQNQFLKYKVYYTSENLGDTSLKETITNVSVQPGQLMDLQNLRTARFGLSQLGTRSIRSGSITLVFVDSNGVEEKITIDINWNN